LIVNSLDRVTAERGASAYAYQPDQQLNVWRTRLGMKIVDERITIRHDPLDPMLGVLPMRGLRPVVWIEQGKLMNLAYSQAYAQQVLGEDVANLIRPSYRMEGGTTPVEEMIQTTKHGVLITRLSDFIVLKRTELLVTGQTHGGVWEIRDGRVLRAVHNMRFTDSPLLAFNTIDAVGPAVPVFAPSTDKLTPLVVPPIKVSSFALTASSPSL
jgi:predicted Zn-dependent protease